MNLPRILLVALFTPLTLSPLQAASKQKPGEVLIEYARRISNIRVDSSPAFKLDVKFTGSNHGSPIDGTYSEIWISSKRWKKELAASGFHRVEVAEQEKRWVLGEDSSSG